MPSALQFRLPWDLPDPLRTPRVRRPNHVEVAGRRWPLVVARHRLARRYVLRLTADGALRLTVPRGASIEGGLRFARTQADWIERQHGRREQARTPWTYGRTVLLQGTHTPIVADGDAITVGPLRWPAQPGVPLRVMVEAGLRRHAAAELEARCLALAAQAGEVVRRVTVRNQRSRWGSCSTRGHIALNWRLIQMPPDVCDYVILHELMHLRQPNHSRAFWREVASVCPGWREAERGLRRNGRALLEP